MDRRICRRTFLELVSLALLSGCSIAEPATAQRAGFGATAPAGGPAPPADDEPFEPFEPGGPFRLGVASGDPLPDGVVLWTRVVDDPAAADGGVPPVDLDVEWIVTADPDMSQIVARGVTVARAAHAHAVHVEVSGLEPATTYYYAFRLAPGGAAAHLGRGASRVGRTKTFPPAGTPVDAIRFAVASCQNWQEGHYTAHAHLAEEDVDFVLFLGDYIYEDGVDQAGVRQHDGDTPRTLDEYRRRHALYKTDEALQAAHAAHPWIVIWDDHEVAGNYAAGFLPGDADTAAFADRRAAAYEAYWEHMPLRTAAPSGGAMKLHRELVIGDLARLVLLDGRQYRSRPACDGKIRPACLGRNAPELSMLGEQQESWLRNTLEGASERWKLVANNVVMSPLAFGTVTNNDQWDGFTVARKRLLDAFSSVDDVVVFTGDIHATLMTEIPSDPGDESSSRVAVELVTTSLSSRGVEGLLELASRAARHLPHVKYLNTKDRGYLVCELGRERLTAWLRAVSTVREPTSPIATVASFAVERGSRRLDVVG